MLNTVFVAAQEASKLVNVNNEWFVPVPLMSRTLDKDWDAQLPVASALTVTLYAARHSGAALTEEARALTQTSALTLPLVLLLHV
jgi:hypothetical protein